MSLRLYILSILTTVVLLISSLLSYQSVRFFFDGFDIFYSNLMEEMGAVYPEGDKDYQEVLDYYLTTDWQKVPEPVRRVFKQPPTEYNVNFTEFHDWIYIAPPERVYSIMAVKNGDRVVYVSRYTERFLDEIQEEKAQKHDGFHIDPMLLLVILGVSTIALFVFVVLLIFKRLAKPVESLQSWASSLTIADVDKPIPSFKFKELNALAELIRKNMASEANVIQREQKFLNYASHELRTPIAVLRTNSSLLEKVNPNPSEKERKIRDRISRASLTMKSMTETLLWLSREEAIDMPIESLDMGQLLADTSHELSYLLSGKEIQVNLESDASSIEAAKVPCQILLNNLIRNAFQHTQSGVVNITHKNEQVVIQNIESPCEQSELAESESLGFGLGMQLVEKLTEQFGWQLTTTQLGNEFKVTIRF